MKKIGVFGGTFDPVHRGHLSILRAAQKHFRFDFVYVVPNRQNPLKGATQLPRVERLKRLRAALRPLKFTKLCLLEWRGTGAHYTVDTLRALKKRHPRAQLFFICGSDLLKSFSRWKNPRQVLRLAVMAVTSRAGSPRPAVRAGFEVFPMKPVRLSSTQIRAKYDKLSASKQGES